MEGTMTLAITVIIRILAVAAIYFSLGGVWLLIKGGFHYFGVTPLGDIGTINSFFTIKIQDLN